MPVLVTGIHVHPLASAFAVEKTDYRCARACADQTKKLVMPVLVTGIHVHPPASAFAVEKTDINAHQPALAERAWNAGKGPATPA